MFAYDSSVWVNKQMVLEHERVLKILAVAVSLNSAAAKDSHCKSNCTKTFSLYSLTSPKDSHCTVSLHSVVPKDSQRCSLTSPKHSHSCSLTLSFTFSLSFRIFPSCNISLVFFYFPSLSLSIQRLQYQGWLAVVANLEDLVTDLKKTGKQMETTFDNYLGKRESYQAQIESFDDDVAVLLQVIRTTGNEKRTCLGKLYLADSCVPCLA